MPRNSLPRSTASAADRAGSSGSAEPQPLPDGVVVLAEGRGRAVLAPGHLGVPLEEPQRWAGQRDAPQLGVLDVHEQTLGVRLLPAVDVAEVAHPARRDAEVR